MSFAAVLQRLDVLTNPYPGLRPFRTADAHLYYGRETQVSELVARLERSHFVAVVGVSGAGKSSLVLAGLIPALQRRENWRNFEMRPKADPYGELAAAASVKEGDLRASSFGLIASLGAADKTLLVVDQFEELFRFRDQAGLSPKEREKQAADGVDFVQLLLTTAAESKNIYVVITMRSDYLGACAEFRNLPETLNGAQYLVPRPTREQLRRAIRGPLGRTQIDEDLVETLLNDLGDDPGRLPLLQHALMRTWRQWHTDDPDGLTAISLEAYKKAGGIERALDLHADELMEGLPEDCVRTLFQRLTARGLGQHERRDPATLADLQKLYAGDGIKGAVDRFRSPEATFLMPDSGELEADTLIDITHESLLWNWTKLKEWVAAEQKAAKILRDLADRAGKFRPAEGPFLTTFDLSEALEWLQRPNIEAWAGHYVSGAELKGIVEFIRASERAAEDAEEKERRRRRSLYTWALAALLICAVFAVLAFVSWWKARTLNTLAMQEHRSAGLALLQAKKEKSRADAARRQAAGATDFARSALSVANAADARAKEQQQLADSITLAAHAEQLVSRDDKPEGFRLALKAFKTRPTEAAREAIADSLPQLQAEMKGHTGTVETAAFSADGQRVVTASDDHTARVWNAATGEQIAKLEGHTNIVFTAAFSADGQRVVTASYDHTARVWNAATGQQLAKLEGHTSYVYTAAFSADGQHVVTASHDQTARVWNAATGQLLAKLEGHTDIVWAAAFSFDGQRVVTASSDRTARVWNAATGQLLAKLEGHGDKVTSAAFSADGQHVVTASHDKTARVWNAKTGQLLAKLEGHTDAVQTAAFSPDGQRVVTASYDRTATVWNAATGQLVAKLEGDAGTVYTAAFSADGQRVLTASFDKTARVWDAATGQLLAKLEGHKGTVWMAAFSADGQRVVTASDDTTARVWNLATGQVLARLEGHASAVNTAAFSADGQRVVTASLDETARVWNAATGQLLAKLEGHTGVVNTAAFSADGQRVVTASGDRTARVWSAATGQLLAKLEDRTAPVYTAEFSADGQRVVTASWETTAGVWNAATGQLLAKLEGHTGHVYTAAFSADGRRVVTASKDGTARVWNAATGQELAKLEGHTSYVLAAAFSADGQRVVTASDDKTARVWDAATGQVLAKLEGHTGPVRTAAFSADSQRVVTASADGTARVWNAATGQLLAKLEGHTGRVHTAAFSPDGQRIVTASADDTAMIFKITTVQDIARLFASAPAEKHPQQALRPRP